MNKKKVGVVFGGMSTENLVSVVSGTSVLRNLNTKKYDIYPIYIDENGGWNEYKEDFNKTYKVGERPKKIVGIQNVFEYLKKMDVVFPVLHGLYGEDGTVQGLFELLKVKYVGCKVLASSVGMDKVYTKVIFKQAGIKQANYKYVRKYNDKYIMVSEKFDEEIMNLKEVCEKIVEDIHFPMFVKPSNSGSSVGVNKATNIQELEKHIEEAAKFDKKVLIEEGIDGREVECAVLGNEQVISSCVGEILPAENFYTFDAKYNNQESKTVMPADLPKDKSNEIRDLAIKAFKAIDGKGLSRIDFFVDKKTGEVYINEINTLPGFTNISMYPKLFEQVGIKYTDLLDTLIELA